MNIQTFDKQYNKLSEELKTLNKELDAMQERNYNSSRLICAKIKLTHDLYNKDSIDQLTEQARVTDEEVSEYIWGEFGVVSCAREDLKFWWNGECWEEDREKLQSLRDSTNGGYFVGNQGGWFVVADKSSLYDYLDEIERSLDSAHLYIHQYKDEDVEDILVEVRKNIAEYKELIQNIFWAKEIIEGMATSFDCTAELEDWLNETIAEGDIQAKATLALYEVAKHAIILDGVQDEVPHDESTFSFIHDGKQFTVTVTRS